MSEFDLDVSDLTKFGDELVAAADGLLAKVKPVVAKGALNVKTQMVKDMKASAHFKQVAHTIGYDDIEVDDGAVEANVGPATEGQVVGDLAHLAYFGGAHGGGGTVPDPQTALDDEAPKFEDALTKIVNELP